MRQLYNQIRSSLKKAQATVFATVFASFCAMSVLACHGAKSGPELNDEKQLQKAGSEKAGAEKAVGGINSPLPRLSPEQLIIASLEAASRLKRALDQTLTPLQTANGSSKLGCVTYQQAIDQKTKRTYLIANYDCKATEQAQGSTAAFSQLTTGQERFLANDSNAYAIADLVIKYWWPGEKDLAGVFNYQHSLHFVMPSSGEVNTWKVPIADDSKTSFVYGDERYVKQFQSWTVRPRGEFQNGNDGWRLAEGSSMRLEYVSETKSIDGKNGTPETQTVDLVATSAIDFSRKPGCPLPIGTFEARFSTAKVLEKTLVLLVNEKEIREDAAQKIIQWPTARCLENPI